MGKPSNATTDPANKDDFLMDKPYFTLSYNNSMGIPNWVSWRLVAEDICFHAGEGWLVLAPAETLHRTLADALQVAIKEAAQLSSETQDESFLRWAFSTTNF